MSFIQSTPAAAKGAGAGDMFLSVIGARTGTFKGESQDADHKDEIEVIAWSWGMKGPASLNTGTAAGKAIMRELLITKNVDRASTGLMSALRSNEPIKKATLTIRKAGKKQLEYLKITIEDGRVTSLDIETEASGASTLVERLAFTFNSITVDYTPQGPDGRPLGGTVFFDQWVAG